MNVHVVTLLAMEPDAETLKFPVLVDRYLETWTLDRIKRAVTEGATLRPPPFGCGMTAT